MFPKYTALSTSKFSPLFRRIILRDIEAKLALLQQLYLDILELSSPDTLCELAKTIPLPIQTSSEIQTLTPRDIEKEILHELHVIRNIGQTVELKDEQSFQVQLEVSTREADQSWIEQATADDNILQTPRGFTPIHAQEPFQETPHIMHLSDMFPSEEEAPTRPSSPIPWAEPLEALDESIPEIPSMVSRGSIDAIVPPPGISETQEPNTSANQDENLNAECDESMATEESLHLDTEEACNDKNHHMQRRYPVLYFPDIFRYTNMVTTSMTLTPEADSSADDESTNTSDISDDEISDDGTSMYGKSELEFDSMEGTSIPQWHPFTTSDDECGLSWLLNEVALAMDYQRVSKLENELSALRGHYREHEPYQYERPVLLLSQVRFFVKEFERLYMATCSTINTVESTATTRKSRYCKTEPGWNIGHVMLSQGEGSPLIRNTLVDDQGMDFKTDYWGATPSSGPRRRLLGSIGTPIPKEGSKDPVKHQSSLENVK